MYKKLISYIFAIIVIIILGVFISKQNNRIANPEIIIPPINENIDGENIPNTIIINEYTLEDIAMHNTQEDCWSTINNEVYDLTPWISKHPGGEKAILGLCGVDGTEAFIKQHDTQKAPNFKLESFLIGSLLK